MRCPRGPGDRRRTPASPTLVLVCGAGEVARSVARALRERGHDVLGVEDSHGLQHAVDDVHERALRIDALVNAPGVDASAGALSATPEDVWDHVIDRDLTSIFRACKIVMPLFVAAGGGAIVNITSSAGYGRAKHIAESAGHGAVIALGSALAYDHFHDHVRVNTIVTGDAAMPAAVGPVAAFLLSPSAEVMSGSIVDVGNAAYQGGR